MSHFLSDDGLLYVWQKLKALLAGKVDKADGMGLSSNDFTDAEKTKLAGISTGANKYTHPSYTARSSGLYKVTVDATGHVSAATAAAKADITALGIPAQDTTYSDMTGASTSAAGAHGLVPAPAAGAATRYLRSDGTWQTPPNTTYADMTGASSSAAGVHGLVPAPAAGASTRYLRSDGTWAVPPDTTYSDMTAATASAAGKHGLVPAPAAGKQGQYLRGDGTWATPTNTTYSAMTGATADAAGKAGLVPAPGAGKQASFLRGDGTWVVPTDTTYSNATTSTSGLMSAADKAKLDGVAAGANKYTLPTASTTLGGVKTTSSVSSASGYTACPIISGVVYYKDTNTTYSAATTSAAGLMSAADKSKLDGFGAASTYALKSDITNVYKYKGSVATAADLPASATAGDVYNVEADGMNYGWTGSAWDALGASFTIDAITNAEIDTILAS